jgi:putative pyruvate formate lyase activating enzyme
MNHDLTYLPHYANILTGTTQTSYLTCKQTPTAFDPSMPLDQLWTIHNTTDRHTPNTTPTPTDQNLLALKHTIASRLTTSCILCERRCHTDRTQNHGACHTKETRIATEFLHTGEETILIPSHTIFFSGCPLTCTFCQNYDISQTTTGTAITPDHLAEIITQRHRQGSRNINWVGGDPTPNLPYILDVLTTLTTNIPQVWNSNMYCTQETMILLAGTIDLYLTDFKFGNDTCARRLANIDNYLTVVQRNHLLAAISGDVLVRHLILPHHIDCCTKPILN